MRRFLFAIPLLSLACAPAVDDPKVVTTDVMTLKYPGNWSATTTEAGGVFSEERLVLGQIAGATFVRISPFSVVPTVMEHSRDAETTIAGEIVRGTLGFDWNDDEPFIETYCLNETTNSDSDAQVVCIEAGSDKASIERARPGIDLVFESFQLQ